MNTDKHSPSNYAESGNGRQRFFLGDSDSESDDDEPKRRFSMSESECSEANSIVVGGPPSTLDFVIDDDSGLGMSADGLEESERNSPANNDSSQIIPLRSVNIGSGFPKNEHKHSGARRSKKYHFNDFYEIKDDHLGRGAYASVRTCVSLINGKEFAVKLVNKHEPGHTRSRILREVDIFKLCRGHPNIVQLVEWFEDNDHFYMVFEKMYGGPLLSHIQRKGCFTEQEAANVTKDIATALKFLHSKGVAHRDIKPENILCTEVDRVSPVKLCDLDLASKPTISSLRRRPSRQLHNVQSEPDLQSPVGSAEFLAPEVVETFVGESLKYDRRCDLWSLGVILYIMLCGYVPFYGECDREDCEWNQGKPCDDCQENLFEKIQQGSFDFPEEEWSSISDEAKDLISHLLVKNVRQRYTATDVLNHPWISFAPETPLLTANNLFRNSSTKDIQQFNDHFNVMNHFASRLSSRVEETIPSLGSTPDEDSTLDGIGYAENVVNEAKKVLEGRSDSESSSDNGVYLEHNVDSQQHFQPDADQISHFQPCYMPYYPPPMINMNGMLIYAPQMAQLDYVHQQPYYYPQQIDYSNADPHYFVNHHSSSNFHPNYQHQNYVPMQVNNNSEAMKNFEAHGGLRNDKPSFGQMHRNRSIAFGNMSAASRKPSQPHGSLSTAISQLGLETCQNAIVRQNSSGKEIHANHQQSRETQVHV